MVLISCFLGVLYVTMGQFWSAIQIFQVFLSPRRQCQTSHSKLQHTKSSLYFRETPAIYATHATNKQTRRLNTTNIWWSIPTSLDVLVSNMLWVFASYSFHMYHQNLKWSFLHQGASPWISHTSREPQPTTHSHNTNEWIVNNDNQNPVPFAPPLFWAATGAMQVWSVFTTDGWRCRSMSPNSWTFECLCNAHSV